MQFAIEILCVVIGVLLTALTSLQAWVLLTLVGLKERTTALETKLSDIQNDTQIIKRRV